MEQHSRAYAQYVLSSQMSILGSITFISLEFKLLSEADRQPGGDHVN